MNPAVLVLIWIRLSITFGYPAARTYEQVSSLEDTAYTLAPHQDYDDTSEISTTSKSDSSTQPYPLLAEDKKASLANRYKTSPFYTNYLLDEQHQAEPNDTRIISIVRVSSTSIVKPKRLEHVTKSVSASRNYFNSFGTANVNESYSSNKTTTTNNETEFENLVTPFVSLLRKTRFDVNENDPNETLDSSASSTNANYIRTDAANFSEESEHLNRMQDSASRYQQNYAHLVKTFQRQSKSSINDTNDSTEMTTEQYTDAFTETDQTAREAEAGVYFDLYDERQYTKPRTYEEREKDYEQPEKVYGEPEKVYGEPEKIYGEPEDNQEEAEKVYGEPEKTDGDGGGGEVEKTYDEHEKYKSETMHNEPETEFVKQENNFGLPESSENSNSYSLFTTRVSDKKSSFIIDNGTHRKYRVEEKTPDGFIVGEYGMVSHRDGSLRGVRYTADSNINPSLIYQTLVKFLSLK